MQQIGVEVVGAEPPQGGVFRHDLGDEEDLVTPSRDRLADERLGPLVHFRRVDVRQPQVEPAPEGGDGVGAVALRDVPRPLAADRDAGPVRAEWSFFPAPRAPWRAYYAAWRAFRWPVISLAASVQGCAERGDAVGRRRLDERIEALGIQTVGAEAAPEGTNTGLEEHGVGLLDQAQVA